MKVFDFTLRTMPYMMAWSHFSLFERCSLMPKSDEPPFFVREVNSCSWKENEVHEIFDIVSSIGPCAGEGGRAGGPPPPGRDCR